MWSSSDGPKIQRRFQRLRFWRSVPVLDGEPSPQDTELVVCSRRAVSRRRNTYSTPTSSAVGLNCTHTYSSAGDILTVFIPTPEREWELILKETFNTRVFIIFFILLCAQSCFCYLGNCDLNLKLIFSIYVLKLTPVLRDLFHCGHPLSLLLRFLGFLSLVQLHLAAFGSDLVNLANW